MVPSPRLITGPLAALEQHLAETVAAAKARDPLAPLTVLIGSTLLRPYLRRRLAQTCGGHANLRLLTMNELGMWLGQARLLRAGRSPLPRLGERILGEEIAGEATGYFARVAQAPGFAQALLRLDQELRHAAITAHDLSAAAGGLRGDQDVNAEKLAALAGLLARAEQRRTGFFSVEDCIAAADPARFDGDELLLYGIWQLSTIQRQMLERLMRAGAPATPRPVRVIVYLPDGQGDEATQAHAPLCQWLADRGAEVERLCPTTDRSTALGQLPAALFSLDEVRQPARCDGSVRLLSAPDPPREVREVARVCLEWATAGIPFHEMAITFRQSETYSPLCDEVFREAGIPVYLHDGRPLASQPLGRSLLALLGLVGSPMRRPDVLEFLTETTLPAETAARYGGFEPAAWDAISREAGIVEGRDQWRDRLRRLALDLRHARLDDEPPEWLEQRLAEIDRFSRFVDDLFARLDAHPARGSWAEQLDFLRDLAEAYVAGAGPALDELTFLSDAGSLIETVTFVRFQRTARAALSQIDSLRLPLPLPRPLGPLETGESRAQGAFGRRGVNVLDVNSLRHLRFRAVAVLGLAERAFPPPRRQDALLLDPERAALNRVLDGEISPRATGPDPEPLQFALAVEAAQERLLLSFARADVGSASPHIPSYFFRSAARALTGRTVGLSEIDQLDPAIFRRVPAGRYGAASPEVALSLAEYERTLLLDNPTLGAACLAARYPGVARARAAWSARWRERTLTAWDGVLPPGLARGIARRARIEQAISATRLESYATCPYRFFLTSLLGLAPVEEPELIERIAAIERGALVHAVLEAFLARCGSDDPPRAERADVHRGWLREIAEAECRAVEERGQAGYPLLWEFEKTSILDDLDAWYTLEADDFAAHRLRPGAFEVRFGPPWSLAERERPGLSTDQPLEVPVNGRTLRFQGRIDRIDWDPEQTAFRVIDYKTGRSWDDKDDRLNGGTRLQLPLYLLAATHALRAHGIDIAWENGDASYFYATRRGGLKRVSFSGRTLAARWSEFERVLGVLAERIGSGDFHPEPGADGQHCRSCPCRPACDSRILQIAARKADSRHPDVVWLAGVE